MTTIKFALFGGQANKIINQMGSSATAFNECQVWLSADEDHIYLHIEGEVDEHLAAPRERPPNVSTE
jgi:hypothetical protein